MNYESIVAGVLLIGVGLFYSRNMHSKYQKFKLSAQGIKLKDTDLQNNEVFWNIYKIIKWLAIPVGLILIVGGILYN